MRAASVIVATILLAPAAYAHDTGEEHDHDFGKPKPPGKFVVAGGLGYALGASLGGAYEKCGAGTTCGARTRPSSFMPFLRAGYELGFGLGFEAELGYASVLARVARSTTLYGEQSNPVAVNITDETSIGGPFAAASVTYSPMRKPIVPTLALGIGQWFTTVEHSRTGTAVTDAQPSPRALTPSGSDTSASFTLLIPEVRVAYPVLDMLQIGVSVGAFVVIGETRPAVRQAPRSEPGDPTPTSNGKPIGFVPSVQSKAESALENALLVRTALYVRALF